jgi:hypothetical protein
MTVGEDAKASARDEAFERQLLAAGRAELTPQHLTSAAWLKFAASATAVQTAAPSANASQAARAGSSSSGWLNHAPAAKWLLVGALGGSLLTLAWLERSEAPRGEGGTAAKPSAQRGVDLPAASNSPAPAPALTSEAPAGLRVQPLRPSHAPVLNRATRPEVPEKRRAPNLAAEVAALDGVRTSIAIGAWADSERQLERYRREFPAGELRAEAEVLAIESLAGSGRTADLKRAAESFVIRHPKDPHVARVLELAD